VNAIVTASPRVGVVAELGAIAERRAEAISLWDGPIQSLWGSLLWFHEQARSLTDRISAGTASVENRKALARCMDTADAIIEEIGRREAQARAQVRGMEPFIGWAKQGSRIDALLADQLRLQRAGLDEESLAGVA
jgi:hypothetical protein